MKRLRVYIAGPYTVGDPIQNIAGALDMGDKVLLLGHTPFIPHTNMLWHFRRPHTPDIWYRWDNEWLKVCDVLLRIPGESPGADAEVRLAVQLRIPVCYSLEDLEVLLLRNSVKRKRG